MGQHSLCVAICLGAALEDKIERGLEGQTSFALGCPRGGVASLVFCQSITGHRLTLGDGKNGGETRGQILGGVLQSDNRQCLPSPPIKEGEYGKTRYRNPEDVRQIMRFKTGWMTATRIL